MTRLSFLFASTFSFLSSGLFVQLFKGPEPVQADLIRLPFAKRINQTSVKNVLKVDRARARAHMARFGIHTGIPSDRRQIIQDPIDDQAVAYVASVGVGSPATQCHSISCLALFYVKFECVFFRLLVN